MIYSKLSLLCIYCLSAVVGKLDNKFADKLIKGNIHPIL